MRATCASRALAVARIAHPATAPPSTGASKTRPSASGHRMTSWAWPHLLMSRSLGERLAQSRDVALIVNRVVNQTMTIRTD